MSPPWQLMLAYRHKEVYYSMDLVTSGIALILSGVIASTCPVRQGIRQVKQRREKALL